jgi:hypothetical protein
MNKEILILTGPQGSGNHMWSKIFSESTNVKGWKQLTQEYWVGHGFEPFAEVWRDPSLFKELEWPHDRYFTSISCPYIYRGGPINTDDNTAIPKYEEFIEQATQAGFKVTVVVIGRDSSVLAHQQQRVRTQVSLPVFVENLDASLLKYDPIFISTELLFLYRYRYIKSLEKILNWSIDISEDKLEEIIKINTNEKYFNYVEEYWLDDIMAKQSESHHLLDTPHVYKKNK